MRRYYLTAGCVARGESPFLREWVEYHLQRGVEHVYVYDNHAPNESQQLAATVWALSPYVQRGLVTLTRFRPERASDLQYQAYTDILRKHGKRTEWLAFMDVDEFFVPVYNETLPEIMQDYELSDVAGLVAPWVVFGTSGHKERQPLVTESFTRCATPGTVRTNVKVIARPSRCRAALGHLVVPRSGCRMVDEDYQTVQRHHQERFLGRRLRINHYMFRSEADWIDKVRRGFPSWSPDKYSPEAYQRRWRRYNKNDGEDLLIQRFVPPLRAALQAHGLPGRPYTLKVRARKG